MPPPATMCGLCAVKTRSGRVRLGLTIEPGGTVSLILPESIKGYEKVELTEADSRNTSAPPTDMVLVGDLVSMNTPGTPRGLNYTPIGQFYR